MEPLLEAPLVVEFQWAQIQVLVRVQLQFGMAAPVEAKPLLEAPLVVEFQWARIQVLVRVQLQFGMAALVAVESVLGSPLVVESQWVQIQVQLRLEKVALSFLELVVLVLFLGSFGFVPGEGDRLEFSKMILLEEPLQNQSVPFWEPFAL